MKVMKIKDILDMEEYLKNRCYCPNEIYDSTGFFYQLFYPETECNLLGENEDYFVIITKPNKDDKSKAQLVIIIKSKKDKGKVLDTVRYDATDNNIKIFKSILNKIPVSELKEKGLRLNEYNEGSTARGLKKVFEIADAIIID